MSSYGQFCSIARTLELLGERWTLLVVRELLMGSRRFSDIRRGIPRISRTMLSMRLRSLEEAGVIDGGAQYDLTEAGRELATTVEALGTWGQRWLPRELPGDELDLDVLVWDMRRRVDREALPAAPVVTHIEAGRRGRYLLLRRSEVSLCSANPGFPVELHLRGPLGTLVGWWRGDLSLAEARASGLVLDGKPAWVRAFPRWFLRYAFSGVPPR